MLDILTKHLLTTSLVSKQQCVCVCVGGGGGGGGPDVSPSVHSLQCHFQIRNLERLVTLAAT